MLIDIDAFDAEARTWLGTPYVPKGRVKGVGADCGGFVYQMYNPWVGPFAPFPDDYPADWALHEGNGERYLDFIMPHVREVKECKPGGLSLFHLGLRYAHAAIMLKNGKYIHSMGRTRAGGVMIHDTRALRAFASNHGNGFAPKHFEAVDG